MEKIKLLELFGGIGACSKALERLGIDYEIADYVEIDKYAVASYNAMHDTSFEPQDITKWDKNIDVDLIMHGSPCQDFSLAGQQAGGDIGSGTRSSLMYETIRIVGKLRPKYVIWENVKNLLSKKHRHNFDAYLQTMESLGYKNYYQVLNAKDYGIPQNRERIFTISIRNDIEKEFVFPNKKELNIKLKDVLENEIDEIDISSKMECHRGNVQKDSIQTIATSGRNDKRVVVNKYKEYSNFYVIPRASDGKLINGSYNRVWKENKYCGALNITKIQEVGDVDEKKELKIRKLMSKECWRLMGFDDADFEKAQNVNSNTQLYKQAGNSIVVNVLEVIFKELFV